MNEFEKENISPEEGNGAEPSAQDTRSSSPLPRFEAGGGGQQQYWSSRDARSSARPSSQKPPHRRSGAEHYTPSPQYQRPYNDYYQSQGYQSRRRQDGQYHYTPGAGWQRVGANEPRYEWNFEEYDRYTQKKGGKKRNRGLVVFSVALLCLLAAGLVGMAGISIYRVMIQPPDVRSDIVDPPAETPPLEGNASQSPDVEPGDSMELSQRPDAPGAAVPTSGKLTIPQVAQKVLPSVVGVEKYENGSQFYEPTGLGSGIIMNTQGYIITNQHVIANADAVKVTLENGEPYEAQIIGADERTDLAVLKINAPDLIPAEFGDSGELLVGETVIAIGNPASMQLAGSVTQGIVSALNREVSIGKYSMTYLQTDAAINPGNSGGALVNEYGQVVGINSSKIVQEGFEGIGFAIPISDAKPIIDELINNGRVTGRVRLGIGANAVDEITARRYNVPMGLQIVTIEPDSDFANKRVQPGDIITHIDGERVYTHDELRKLLDTHKVGDTVRITLFRQSSITQGSSFDVTVTLMEDMG